MKVALLVLATALGCAAADAQYFKRPDSDLDASIMRIDEEKVLGRAIDPQTELVDQNGSTFRWGDLAGKPTLLVLSYFTCDGSCAIINQNLHDLLGQMTRYHPGTDFNLLTLSFDTHDTLATTGAFRKHLELASDLAGVWTFATFKSEAALKAQTERIGFKFFWSPQDGVFLHPGAYLFFSPKGELARVLYQTDVDARDVELAVLDAHNGDFKPSQIVDYALSLCYSYNYHDGKYRLSIPLLVGIGSLGAGVMTLAGSALIFRLRERSKLGESIG